MPPPINETRKSSVLDYSFTYIKDNLTDNVIALIRALEILAKTAFARRMLIKLHKFLSAHQNFVPFFIDFFKPDNL